MQIHARDRVFDGYVNVYFCALCDEEVIIERVMKIRCPNGCEPGRFVQENVVKYFYDEEGHYIDSSEGKEIGKMLCVSCGEEIEGGVK